jgi:hypothetical protein
MNEFRLRINEHHSNAACSNAACSNAFKPQPQLPNLNHVDLCTAWWRFIDDILIIWDWKWGSFKNFHKIIQNIHTNFKITLNEGKPKINFLDITLKPDSLGNISRDIYKNLFLYYIHPFCILSS